MTAKEYLSQMKNLDALIQCRIRELDYWRDLSRRISGCDFEPHYDSNKPTESKFARCIEKMDEIQREIDENIVCLVALRKKVNFAIDMLDSKEEQLLLRCRYMDNMSWEEIGKMMNVSIRTVHRFHSSALQNLFVPI